MGPDPDGPILALDTALTACSAAVLMDGRLAAERYAEVGKGQAELLMGQIDQVLAEAVVSPSGLARIGVTIGPGSFSGVRIGLSVARGISLVTGAPVAGITTLAALAADSPPGSGRATVAAIDARRGEIYVQVFGPDGMALDQPSAMTPPAAAAALPSGPLILVGSGAALLVEAAARGNLDAQEKIIWPRASAVARLAANAKVSGSPPDPLYLRAPDAKAPKP